MKIRMLKNAPGSINGINVQYFKAGEVYDSIEIGDDLANSFLEAKLAELTVPVKVIEETQKAVEKMVKEQPENKMVKAVPEDKTEPEKEDEKDEEEKSEPRFRKKNL